MNLNLPYETVLAWPVHIHELTYLFFHKKIGFIDFISDTRTLFNYSATVAKGSFYNGDFGLFEGHATYRYQPYLNMTLNFSYNDINLPGNFKHAHFWLLWPKLDLTLSDKVFFSSFVQYNEQIDNMNINLRFQWR